MCLAADMSAFICGSPFAREVEIIYLQWKMCLRYTLHLICTIAPAPHCISVMHMDSRLEAHTKHLDKYIRLHQLPPATFFSASASKQTFQCTVQLRAVCLQFSVTSSSDARYHGSVEGL